MIRKTLIAAAILAGTTVIAQTKADYDLAVGKFQAYYNSTLGDSIYNMLSDRSRTIMTREQAAETFKKLHAQLGDIQSYEFSKQSDGLSYYKTSFEKSVLSLILSLTKDNKLETFRFMPYIPETAPDDKSKITLKTQTGEIHGTVTIPNTDGKPVPVVLIVAGSGPTDRDGNSPLGVKASSYKMLADSFMKAGIACVRYDKRGIGASAAALKSQAGLSFDTYADDVAGFIKMLKADNRFSKVYVLGHSEGSLLGMVAINKEPAAGFISVAGLGQRVNIVIEKQLKAQSDELATKARVILDSLKAGYDVKHIDEQLAEIFNASLQPYLRSWIKYDPQEEIKKIYEPVLIVQGTTDIQVGVEEANLLKKASHNAILKIIGGMNHILKEAPEDRQKNMDTYSDADLPLCPGLVSTLVHFIKTPPPPGKKK